MVFARVLAAVARGAFDALAASLRASCGASFPAAFVASDDGAVGASAFATAGEAASARAAKIRAIERMRKVEHDRAKSDKVTASPRRIFAAGELPRTEPPGSETPKMDALPASEITALLGRGTRFEGKLYFEGRVRIDGAFKGEIKSNDTLIIGEGADIHAEIDVATVIVRGGVVHGNVRASQAIEIHSPGKLVGNVHSPSLYIERGVEFQGSCRMDAVETNAAAPPQLPKAQPRA